ncbi:hypothetical protein C8R44DRAFT_804948 [Mycena epipterygia]|nr:hypothetical protein C8R44DRAFT_804948 [Mycena epipterygia]
MGLPPLHFIFETDETQVPSYCSPTIMSSEDRLFILYTSGLTGKLMRTTGRYLLCAALTFKYVLDVHEVDRFACMADVGWITGHTCVSPTSRPP